MKRTNRRRPRLRPSARQLTKNLVRRNRTSKMLSKKIHSQNMRQLAMQVRKSLCWCERYRRMRRSGATRRIGGGLGGSEVENPHPSQRTRRMGHPACSTEKATYDGDGYYMVDRPDRGRRWDLDIGQHGEGGEGGHHARHRHAD